MTLAQITRREGTIDRVPRGETPVIELELDGNEYVVYVDLKPRYFDQPERKTVDWRWIAYVVDVLGGSS